MKFKDLKPGDKFIIIRNDTNTTAIFMKLQLEVGFFPNFLEAVRLWETKTEFNAGAKKVLCGDSDPFVAVDMSGVLFKFPDNLEVTKLV